MERKHKYDVGTLVKTETYMKGLRYGCDVRGTATLIVVGRDYDEKGEPVYFLCSEPVATEGTSVDCLRFMVIPWLYFVSACPENKIELADYQYHGGTPMKYASVRDYLRTEYPDFAEVLRRNLS